MIAHAAWSRLGGVIVVDDLRILAGASFAALEELNVTHLMIEDYDLRSPGLLLQQIFDLRVIDPLNFFAIVKVFDRGLVMGYLEALLVERQIPEQRASVADRNGLWIEGA